VDCLALIQAWERQSDSSEQLHYALKELSQTLLAQSTSLCLQFVPSPLNQARALSRVLSDKDCTLAPEPWKESENLFGPHTFDLMALDSNIQIGCSGSPLSHFTPFPTPDSREVSVIAKHIVWRSTSMVNYYSDLEQIVKPGHSAEVLSSTALCQASSPTRQYGISSYQDVNELKNFSPIFP